MAQNTVVKLVGYRAPVSYSPQLAANICARLAAGLSLRQVCRQNGMPSRQSVLRWVGERADFRDAYCRALEARGCSYAEQVVDVADRVLRREIAPDAARVAIDALKWAAARMAPKIYGDRVALTGADGGDVGIRVSSARAQIEGKLARLATEVGAAGLLGKPD